MVFILQTPPHIPIVPPHLLESPALKLPWYCIDPHPTTTLPSAQPTSTPKLPTHVPTIPLIRRPTPLPSEPDLSLPAESLFSPTANHVRSVKAPDLASKKAPTESQTTCANVGLFGASRGSSSTWLDLARPSSGRISVEGSDWFGTRVPGPKLELEG
ncbi:hypothetical protein P280DRAFT_44761 [Massarina eburnea CBS 473.64]|uniref:Uncharacterized protein n=1 Tax=Massarina eburnea CBS 473.64 TaxID=1395130 RepID=A0A6A6RWZ2_9PLEO|nr:hypothetical protein P280DRAFT_44761 [Massarina eburnea CBS 473.64]